MDCYLPTGAHSVDSPAHAQQKGGQDQDPSKNFERQFSAKDGSEGTNL